MRLVEGDAPPDLESCSQPDDIGTLYHDRTRDIWFECMRDSRSGAISWSILPGE